MTQELTSAGTLTVKAVVDYELHSSWWAGYCGWDWLQNLAVRYIVWKVRRKYRRYRISHQEREEVIHYLAARQAS